MDHMMGVETEYGFAALDAAGNRIPQPVLSEQFLEHARERLPHLSGPDNRLFLANGGLLYMDYGGHPEFATPECTTPDAMVQYIHAGDAKLAMLSKALESSPAVAEVCVFKCNVDYTDPETTWGCHESYLYRSPWTNRSPQLIPHLISRIIFTGAGGWNNCSPGLEFSLSPRVNHLVQDLSGDTTTERGIFHSKNESHCGRHKLNRLHLICGDSAFSETTNWLKMGTTSLVVAMVDQELRVGDPVRPDSAVHAMRCFAADPTCRVKLADGAAMVTALDIQRHYLEQVELHLDARFMPPWAGEVCRRWKAMLDRLETDPESLASELDWSIKLAVFREHVRRHSSIPWACLPTWTNVIKRIQQVSYRKTRREQKIDPAFIARGRREEGFMRRAIKICGRPLEEHGQTWEDLEEFQALRWDLFELDARFGEIGDNGIFRALDAAGVLNHRVLAREQLERAIDEPPPVGRPLVRGRCVKRLADENEHYQCGWERIWSENRHLDLSDPFEAEENWTSSSHMSL